MIRRTSARRVSAVAITAGLLAGAAAGPAWAHPDHDGAVVSADGSVTDGQHDAEQDDGNEGHLPAKQENVRVIGKLEIAGVVPGQIADVAAHKDTAYLASFREGTCTKGGFYVVDIKDAAAPKQLGFIPSSPGTYVGEGMQALSVETPAFTGDLLVHNNETCAGKPTNQGGITLVDVSNPAAPKILAANVGDTVRPDGSTRAKPTNVHSAYAWAEDGKLYAVLVDNEEGADVDIMDITDPRAPRLIAEYDLDATFKIAQPALGDSSSFLHDMVVTKIKGRQTMIASYWDGGYVQLDVTDPTKATLINQTDFAVPDTERAKRGENVLPEGNAHQAEFTADRSAFVATDEDFSPYKLESKMADGTAFRAQPGSGYKQVRPGETVTGPTVYVGEACTALPTATKGTIAVVERGTCGFQMKADNVAAAGYETGIVFNSLTGGDAIVNMAGTNPAVRFSFVGRSDGLRILNSYDAGKPSTQQASPAVGTKGQDVTFRSFFDGWGYVHLYDRTNAEQLDTYAIPESQDAKYAQGFGDLSVHEVATDPKSSLAYLSYYAGGFRVLDTAGGKLKEVGAFIDEGGNNFWGVEVTRVPKYGQVVLASDRDFGLYVLQYAPSGGK
ncbi:MAG: hypothetical protein M3P31_04745 [Actinomycetota bacterium]|nr:hypothetical protein [Actinomycetota bacterium]